MDTEPKVWLVGTGGGLYGSVDGVGWENMGGYTYRVTSIVRSGNRVCVGVGSGLWDVWAGDRPWVQLHDETLTEVLDLAWAPGDPGVVAASAYGVGVGQRREHDAVRWTWLSDELAVNERFSNAIAVDPADENRWLVGTEAGVLVAEDAGKRWVHSGLMGMPVRALLRIGDTWWAGTDARGVWQSADGLAWRRAGRGLDEGTVFALAAANGRILAGTTEGMVIGDGEGRWQRMGPRGLVGAVACHPQAAGFWMAGCVPGGLWVTEDAGRTWRYVPGVPKVVEAILAPEDKG